MFIRRISDNMRKQFTFVLRRLDGSEYEIDIPANSEAEAERRLEDFLEISYSPDALVGLKRPSSGG
jgi:hypothetical protein